MSTNGDRKAFHWLQIFGGTAATFLDIFSIVVMPIFRIKTVSLRLGELRISIEKDTLNTRFFFVKNRRFWQYDNSSVFNGHISGNSGLSWEKCIANWLVGEFKK